MKGSLLYSWLLVSLPFTAAKCPNYDGYSKERHPPFSPGRYKLPFQRPAPWCRTFHSRDVEDVIGKMKSAITDPDLYRLFQNTYPNTLDTAIRWKGVSWDDDEEELTFIITGDINAMWLRDSANQMKSYSSLLKPDKSPFGIASLFRGVINLQARYLLTSPYCNSFQPPEESEIPPAENESASGDTVTPPYSNSSVFECKYELDSLASFLEVSSIYYERTNDLDFFGRFQWIDAIQAVLDVAKKMQQPTYGADGRVLDSAYKFTRFTTRATESFSNDGIGNPVGRGTGLIRSGFRPSDDSTIFQLFIPANMMFTSYLESSATIMTRLGNKAPGGLADEMKNLARTLRQAIDTYGIVPVAKTPNGLAKKRDQSAPPADPFETVYAFEVDGFGSSLIMDDANIPSLLSAPFLGYLKADDPVYQRTRRRILDDGNVNGDAYYMRGPVINAVGGPHQGPGQAWPMASIVRILTSDDDREITGALHEILSSTDGLGLIHESVNTFNQSHWTREW